MRFRILALMSLAAAASADLGPTTLLDSFETPADLAAITPHNATFSQTSQDVTDGKSALLVNFAVAAYPNIEWNFSAAPRDWHTFSGLAVDVFNPGSQDVPLSVRMDDSVTATGAAPDSLQSSVTVPAQSAATVVFLFSAPSALSMGMKVGARLPGFLSMTNAGATINTSHITALQFFLGHPTAPQQLIFDNLRLINTDAQSLLYDNIVDAYGQFTKETWPGKVASDADFATQLQADAQLGPPPSGWDQYGGFAAGPSLPPTGFFHTWQQPNGTWWLVTPSGHLFFSLGANAVQSSSGATYITGREWMFTSLPSSTDPLAANYGKGSNSSPGGEVRGFSSGQWFNFHTANLQRKYGLNYKTPWDQTTLTRLHAWGFNTLGNWSDTAIYAATDARGQRMPYVGTGSSGSGFAHVITSADYWGPMPDPFDPKFSTGVDTSLKAQLTANRNDPYLLGYFVDNELSWASGKNSTTDTSHFSLAFGVLAGTSTSPAKQTWVQTLTAQYVTIDALNQAWGTTFASFTDLLSNAYTPPSKIVSAAMRSDFSAFIKAYAEQYFKTVAGVIHKYDPNHLYLGAKFSSFALETAQACAEYCDAISFDIYQTQVDPKTYAFLNGIGKPAITAEFHFGSLDRGMFGPGLVQVASQTARGQAYATYLQSVITNPNFVGAHWFEYVDEPLTGRLNDGEDYGIGLVSNADSVYTELTAAALAANQQVYTTRFVPTPPKRTRRRP
jgi:hypothetical protein